MLELDEWERVFFVENRKLTTDSAGNEMLVGLTLAESLEYLRYVRDMTPGKAGGTTGQTATLNCTRSTN